MGLIFRREGDGQRGKLVAHDDHWTYAITSYRGEHVLEISSTTTRQIHRASMYTKRGAQQLAREFHRLGEDYDDTFHGGRDRFAQARESTDEP